MGIVRSYDRYPPFFKLVLDFCWRWWIPILALCQVTLFWVHSIEKMKILPWKKRLPTILQLGLTMVFSYYVLFIWGQGLHYVMTSVFYLIITEIVNLPHHSDLCFTSKAQKKLRYKDQHLVSRSCTFPFWISQYLLLNFNYHREHHMFPWRPFADLPKIHTELNRFPEAEAMTVSLEVRWHRVSRENSLRETLRGPHLARELEGVQPELERKKEDLLAG